MDQVNWKRNEREEGGREEGFRKNVSNWAGALVLWLWEETHVPKVVGSNPCAGYWMDMTFFHIDLL